MTLYPLKFNPQLKHKVWGGQKLSSLLGKTGGDQMGESWELSGVEGNVSMVSNGKLAGTSLEEMIEEFGSELLGKKVFEKHQEKFPLLFKFIDANQVLSVQLHPDDRLAKERHNSFGKTEMWYIIDAEPEAELILGFNRKTNPIEYQSHLERNKLKELLHAESVESGEAFFIAPGTVHAIGAGVLLAEIQQTSDITYRIYDWDRPDSNGKMRELHTELALDAIDFDAPHPKIESEVKKDEVNTICTSDYFQTSVLQLSKTMKRDLSGLDSFVVYMCTEGGGKIQWADGEMFFQKGDTILIPAVLNQLILQTKGCTLLEVSVP